MKFWKSLSPDFRDILTLLAVLAIFFVVGVLSGCASGVQMTDAERLNCRNQGCGVFTLNELRALAEKYFDAGYVNGWTDSNKQASRDL